MLKKRNVFLKKSKLAVSVALFLSAQVQAQIPKSITDSESDIIWIDNGFAELNSVTVIARKDNNGENFAVGSGASILDANKSMAVGNDTVVSNADNSVALGYGSQVNGESNVLSVGAGPSGYGFSVDEVPETRRIINVSDGIKYSDAVTKGQMDNAIADSVRISEDSLRGEIGGVLKDARAHTDTQVTAARDALSKDIIAGTSAAVAYTDATALALHAEHAER